MTDTSASVASSQIVSGIQSSVGGSQLNLVDIGSYTGDGSLLSFIREQPICYYMTGLRPNTRVYAYFDRKNVSGYCRPCTLDINVSNVDLEDLHPTGAMGDPLITSSTGTLAGIFYCPAGAFFIGDREFLVADTNDITSGYTTNASVFFHAYNYPLASEGSSLIATRPSDNGVSATTNRGSGISISSDPNKPRLVPLCQTFYIGTDISLGQEGIFLDEIDVYFKTKDSTKGITLEIRTVENGYPTSVTIPFSKKYITTEYIDVSSDASADTSFKFDSPVFLKAGYEYAFCLTPDGFSPNFSLWTCVVGEHDVTTNGAITRNWGEGTLFTSTTGSTWTPIQTEYLKFKINRAAFENSGQVTLTNKDYEFFSISNTSGIFRQGELCYQNSANATGTISVNSASYVVVGTGTTFTGLSAGQQIAIKTVDRSDVVTINQISNATYMNLTGMPLFSNTAAVYQKAPIGRCVYFDTGNLFLESSTANSTVYFASNSQIIGVESNTSTTIKSVVNKVVNRFQPLIYSTAVHGTDLTFSVKGIDTSYGNTGWSNYNLSSTNFITDKEVVIASRTNEILYNGGAKSLTANLSMVGDGSRLSPVIDLQSSSILGYRNVINQSSYAENTKNGSAASKWISKIVTLKEGLDSEDIMVYLTAYKPAGTDIEVYGKFLNSTDPEVFDTKDWTLLQSLTSNTMVSDSINRNDFKEFQYTLPSSPVSFALPGVLSVNTTSATVLGSGTTFSTDLKTNDIVKVFSDSSQITFQIAKVTAIANDTSMTIESNSAFTSSIAIFDKVNFPKSAFKNPQNENIIRYYGSTGVAYDTYKSFAMKIILKSDTSYIVPRVKDIRAIALSV